MSKRTLVIPGMVAIFDDGEIGIMLRAADGEVGQDVQRRAYAVQKRMKRIAPVFNGDLRDGITVESARQAPDGPASRVISNAPHTLVNELGRGAVMASGLNGYTPTRRQHTRKYGSGAAQSTKSLGNASGRALALEWRETPGGPLIYSAKTGPVRPGSKFMERSIEAAID